MIPQLLSHQAFMKASSSHQRQRHVSHLRERHCLILDGSANQKTKNIFHKHCIYTGSNCKCYDPQGTPEDNTAPLLNILHYRLHSSTEKPVSKRAFTTSRSAAATSEQGTKVLQACGSLPVTLRACVTSPI